MRIGAGFCNFNDNGSYINVVLDDEFKAIFPAFKELKIVLKELTNEERTKETSPHYRVDAFVPKEKN